MILLCSTFSLTGRFEIATSALESISSTTTPTTAMTATPIITVPIIVILVEFKDAKHAASRESLHDLVFVQMNKYYMEASYGKVEIKGDITERWYTLPTPFSTYKGLGLTASLEDRLKLVKEAIEVADQEVNFRKYLLVLIVLPDVRFVSFAPQRMRVLTNDGSEVSRAVVTTEAKPLGVIAHEVGHYLGLMDLYDPSLAVQMGSTDEGAIYAGPWDLMSMVFRGCIHFSAYNKIALGWIIPKQVKVVPAGQTQIVQVDPLELANQTIYAIKIPMTESRYYLIEVRQKIGFDKVLPNSGVLISSILIPANIGRLNIIDANPSTKTLDDATFGIGPKNQFIFKDEEKNLSVIVLEEVGLSYRILVTQASADFNLARKAVEVANEAETSLIQAFKERRTVGLSQANESLQKAIEALNSGNFDKAIILANETRNLAEKATKSEVVSESPTPPTLLTPQKSGLEGNTLVLAAAIIGVSLVAAVFITKKRKNRTYPSSVSVSVFEV